MNYQRTVPQGMPTPTGSQSISSQQQQPPPPQQQQQQSYHPPSGDNLNQSMPSYYQPSNDSYGNSSNPNDGLNLTISLHPNNNHEMNNQSYPARSDYNPPRNNQLINRSFTYAANNQNNHPPALPPPPAPATNPKRRVQIIDHNRQTPSTTINDYAPSRNSRNSNATPSYSYQTRTPDPNIPQPKYKPPPMPIHGSTSIPPGSSISHQHHDHSDENKHGNIHEYLYGLAAPDPGLLFKRND